MGKIAVAEPALAWPKVDGCCETPVAVGNRCMAEARRGRCKLCVRRDDCPPPFQWYGVGWNFAGRANVQAIRNDFGPGKWLVVVFLRSSDRYVDTRFPILAVNSKVRAVELAKRRAMQLVPDKIIECWPGEDEQWRCGDVVIAVAEPGR